MALRISKNQTRMLGNSMRDAFVERMVSRVHCKFRAEASRQNEEKIRDKVLRAIDKAGRYGISGQCHLTRFIDYVYILGPDFDCDLERPWARMLLENSKLTEEEKIESLDAHIYFIEGRKR